MEPDPPVRPSRRRPPRATLIVGTLAVAVVAVASVAIAAASLAPKSAEGGGAPTARSAEESAAIMRSALESTAPDLPSGMPTAKPDTLGKPLDAPTLEEFGYARALARTAETGDARRVDGSAGYEFLSLDVADRIDPGARVLEVQSYDYATSQLVSQRVDLVAGTVTEERASGARPAPSAREGLFAMNLLLQSDQAATVREKFAELTGEVLTSPAQLRYVPTSSVPALALRAVPQCATDRCITFQGRSRDGVWLYLNQLVVDLTDKTVLTLT